MTDIPEDDKPQVSRSGRILKKTFKLRELEESHAGGVDEKRMMSPNAELRRRKHRHSKARNTSNTDGNAEEEMQRSISRIRITRPTCKRRNIPSPYSLNPRGRRVSLKIKPIKWSCPTEKEDTDSSSIESSSVTSSFGSEPDSEFGNESDQHFSPSLEKNSYFDMEESFEPVDSNHDSDKSDGDRRPVTDHLTGEMTTDAKRSGSYERDPDYVGGGHGSKSKKKTNGQNSDPSGGAAVKGNLPRRIMSASLMLWKMKHESKIKAMFGNLNHVELYRKLGEMWKDLPEAERVLWKRRANQAFTGKSQMHSKNAATTSVTYSGNNIATDLTLEEQASLGVAPIDSAARLKLLGDSLTTLGIKLQNLDCHLAPSGIYSVLLDSLLCSVVPLLSLTREIAGLENLPDDVFLKMSDHIAYFMPGL